jgi:uncharacterized protein (DUF1697 family)
MARHVAFLRGVNLGKNRRVTSGGLRRAVEGLGYEDVATFRTSGNLIFDAPGGGRAEIAARVEAALRDSLGFEIAIFLRSARQVKEIASQEPFPRALVEDSAGKLQVALLPRKPPKASAEEALALGAEGDRLALRGTELYWLPSGAMRDTGLDLRALEAAVGPWTMRTMGTIEQIAERYCTG